MPHNSTWDSVYKELMDYSETKDNCNVPNTYVCKNGVNLTRWIKNQKVKYRNKILENDRIERLNKLKGWYFELNDPNRSWEEIFEELKHKTLIEKSTLGSKSLSDFEDWIWSQKKRKSENKLSEDKISLLESIFNWTWEKNNKKKSWGDRYGQLVMFYEENGTTKVNDSYRTDDNFSLGTWIKTQRQNYKIGTINNDQKSLLSSLGDWSWDPNNEAWNLNYNVVLAYYNEYKNLDFNHSTVYKDFAIGSWSNKQRQKYKNKILDASKIALLEELPEWRWSFKDEAWEDGIEQLQLYIKEHGNPIVHRSYVSPDGFKLGDWVSRNKSNNLLIQDRIDRLEALSGWVWTMKKE